MKNKVHEGNVIDVVLQADTLPGTPLQIGNMLVVCIAGGLAGQTCAFAFTGTYLLPKAAGAGTAISQGAPVYFDPAVSQITGTIGSLKLSGYCWKAAANGDTTVEVRLLG